MMNSGDRFGRNSWIDLHHVRRTHDAGDRGDVVDEIEIELLVERCADRIVRPDQEERIAVWGCTDGRLGADSAAAARPVLDDELLSVSLRQHTAWTHNRH
jgi:hypothetical protein